MQRPAKPCTPVRFRPPPPIEKPCNSMSCRAFVYLVSLDFGSLAKSGEPPVHYAHCRIREISMATKRLRSSGSWEFTVRRKGLLPRPVSFTFETEKEGDAYCSRLEIVPDRGISPPELVRPLPDIATIRDRAFLRYFVRATVASGKPQDVAQSANS